MRNLQALFFRLPADPSDRLKRRERSLFLRIGKAKFHTEGVKSYAAPRRESRTERSNLGYPWIQLKTGKPLVTLLNRVHYLRSTKTPVLGNAIPVLGVKLKRAYNVFSLFFNIDLCTATSFERFRRELPIDMAERRSILKNNQNTHYPRFSFTPKV